MTKNKCKKQYIRKETCYIKFYRSKRPEYDYSMDFGYTIRGEMVIADYDKKGRIISIELVDIEGKCKKPCQSTWVSLDKIIKGKRNVNKRKQKTRKRDI